MRVDAEPEDSQSLVEIMFPHRGVPLARAALEHLGPPDVVHQYVDVPMRSANLVSQLFHLTWDEVIDRHADAVSAEPCDQFRRFFDRFWTLVVRARRALRPRAAPRTDNGRTRLAQGRGDSPARAARRACDDRDAATK